MRFGSLNEDQYVQQTHAACLDGSPPAIWRSSSFGNKKWIIFLQGGGWCTTAQECQMRSRTDLGSSKNQPATMKGGGVLSKDPKINPDFYNWNRIYVHYCDGSSYSSYAKDPIAVPVGKKGTAYIRMRGYRNLQAVFEWLKAEYRFDKATDVILGGGSAGSQGVYLHAEDIRNEYVSPKTRFSILADAGFFLDHPNINGLMLQRDRMQRGDRLWNATINQNTNKDCLKAYPDDPWKCLMAPYVLPFVQSDIFIVNPPADSWQIKNILGVSCDTTNCPKEQADLISAYTNDWVTTFQGIVANKKNVGYIVNSCWIHVQTYLKYWNHYAAVDSQGNKHTLQQTFSDWYFKTRTWADTHLIDVTRFPQNPSCPSNENDNNGLVLNAAH